MIACSLCRFAKRGHDLVFVLTNLSSTETCFTMEFLLCSLIRKLQFIRNIIERSMINQMCVMVVPCYLSSGWRAKYNVDYCTVSHQGFYKGIIIFRILKPLVLLSSSVDKASLDKPKHILSLHSQNDQAHPHHSESSFLFLQIILRSTWMTREF